MPQAIQQQKKFTQGEIDPEMLARDDIEQFYGAASLLQNVFTYTQGGVGLSPGLEYIATDLGSVTRAASPTITAPNGGTGHGDGADYHNQHGDDEPLYCGAIRPRGISPTWLRPGEGSALLDGDGGQCLCASVTG